MSEQNSEEWLKEPKRDALSLDLKAVYEHELSDEASIDDMRQLTGQKKPAHHEIVMTQEKFNELSVADPESSAVQEFLAEHAVEPAGDIVVNIDGVGEKTVTVDAHDFFTTVAAEKPQAPTVEELTPAEALRIKEQEDLAEESFDALEVNQLENGEPVHREILGAENARKFVDVPTLPPPLTSSSIAAMMGGSVESTGVTSTAKPIAEVFAIPAAQPEIKETTDKPEGAIKQEVSIIDQGAIEADYTISKLDLLVDDAEDLNALARTIDASEDAPDASLAILSRVEERLGSIYSKVDLVVKRDIVDVATRLEAVLHSQGEDETLFDGPAVDQIRATLGNKVDELYTIVTQVGVLKQNTQYLEGSELRLLADKLVVLAQDTNVLKIHPKVEVALLELRR